MSHGINRRRIRKKTAITVPKLGDMQCTRFMEAKELDRSNVSYTEERETKLKSKTKDYIADSSSTL